MPVKSYQSEAELENQLIKQLNEQDYASVELNDYDALLDNFRKQFCKFNAIKLNNKDLSDKEWERLTNYMLGNSVFDSAKILRDKYVLERDDGTKVYVSFIDEDHTKNIYQVTHQTMAKRLGVTAPAVNKWENNNTLPDVALLAPISRLLGITTDILLGFQENLSAEEISAFIRKMNQDLDTRNYEEVFKEAKEKIELYPNCELLIWQTAVILHARLSIGHIAGKDDYDEVIFGWFERCLQSDDERIRRSAADSLFNAYMQKDDYEKAQSYLSWLASDSPERKRKEGLILSKTGKRQEAYRSYEELLFSNYQFLSLLLNDLKILYMEDENHEMAWKIADMQSHAAKVFEMGRYNEVSCGLDVASWEKDASKTAQIMQQILESIDQIGSFSQADLYQHMSFKEFEDGFIEGLRSKIIEEMNGESYSYMSGNEQWQELMCKYSAAESKETAS